MPNGESLWRRLSACASFAIFLAATLQSHAFAADAREVKAELWQFERAEATKSEFRKRPAPDAVWKEVLLPESWAQTFPGYTGQVWYRMRIELPAVPRDPYGVYISNRRGSGLVLFVNGAMAGSDIQSGAQFGNRYSPQLHVIPPALLRAGTNLVEIAMTGDARFWAGLGRVSFGSQNPIRVMYRMQNNVENGYQLGQMILMFVLGLLGLTLWLARRSDALAFWFGLGALVWSVAFGVRIATLGIDIGVWNHTTALIAYTITPLFTIVACVRAAQRKFPLFEASLWAAFLGANVWMHIDPVGYPRAVVFDYLANAYTALVVVAAGWVFATQRDRLGWSLYVFLVAVALSVLFPIHDVLRDAGVFDLDRPSLRHFQTVDLVFGMGAIVVERYLAATRATETMNAELERRVAEKTAQIEEVSRRMQAIREERALAIERERILADMHDGVGASLVALTHVAQDESVGRAELAQRARDALQDLRMAIDSLESYEGDLATVLGNMRQRLGQSVAAAGLQLEWAVEDLPVMKTLTPSVVLDVQRIVYEAVTNAVRHARASRVRVAAARSADGRVRVSVEDDGAGFDVASASAGHGLRNLRRRAERLGAGLEIRSATGGTSVILELPTGEAAGPAKESASTHPGVVPVFGLQQA